MMKLLTVATFVSFGFCKRDGNENEDNIPANVTVDEQNNDAHTIQSNIEPDNNFDIEKEDEDPEMQKAIYQSLSSASNSESSFSNLERSSSRSENTSDEIDQNMSEFKKEDQVLWRDEQCTIVDIDLTEDPPRDCTVKVNGTEREVGTELSSLTKVVTASTEHLSIHQVEELSQKANVDFDELRKYYETALVLDPSCFSAHNHLGHVLQHYYQDYDEARNHYETALDINPSYAIAHNNLGVLLETHYQDYDEARKHYETALDLRGIKSFQEEIEPLQEEIREEGANYNDRYIENTPQAVTYTTSNTAKENISRTSKTTVFCIIIGVVFLCVIISFIVAIVLHKHKQAANHSQASKKPLPNKDLSKTEEKGLSSIDLQDTRFDRTALNDLTTISLEELPVDVNSNLPATIEVSEKEIDTDNVILGTSLQNVSAIAADGDTQIPMAPEHIV